MSSDSNKAILTLEMPTGIHSFPEYQLIAQQQAAQQLNCQPQEIALEYPRQVWTSRKLVVTVRPAGTLVAASAKRLIDWRKLFQVGAVCAALVFLVAAWQWQAISQQLQEAQAEYAKVTSQVQALKASAPASPDQQPQRSPLDKAKQVVLQDINPFFGVIEGVRVPQVRLKQLTMDMSNQSMQVTYELRDAAQAARVSEALAAASDGFIWALGSISEGQAQWTGKMLR